MKMTIIITASFFLLAIVANAQSETENRERLQIGLKAGGSISNVYDSKGEDFDANAKLGFSGGAFLAIPLGRLLGLQPEFLITQKGFKGSGRLLGENYNFKRTTTFFDIPLLVAVKPAEFLTIVAGPQYSYLLQQRDVFTSSFMSHDQAQEFQQDNIRKNIFGVIGGIDININHIVISGRIGMDLVKNRGDGNSDTPRYRNVSGQVTVGYKFL